MNWLTVTDPRRLLDYGFKHRRGSTYVFELDLDEMADTDVELQFNSAELIYNPKYGFGLFVDSYADNDLPNAIISLPSILVTLIRDGVVITGGNCN